MWIFQNVSGITPFYILLVQLSIFSLGCSGKKTSTEQEKGFVSIFDGQTLDGWVGDDPFWSVKNGAIHGQITDSTIIKRNRFLIYQGDVPGDFELKVEYRVSEHGNSGINYRSEDVEGIDFYALKGYQCDIDGQKKYVGSNYEERIRRTLARTGEIVILPDTVDAASLKYAQRNMWTIRKVTGQTASTTELLSNIKDNDWNEVHLIIKGNRLQHYINGQLMSDVTDNDKANRRMDGKIGVQVHMGPPMTIEYRNFRVKEL